MRPCVEGGLWLRVETVRRVGLVVLWDGSGRVGSSQGRAPDRPRGAEKAGFMCARPRASSSPSSSCATDRSPAQPGNNATGKPPGPPAPLPMDDNHNVCGHGVKKKNHFLQVFKELQTVYVEVGPMTSNHP